MAGYLYIIMAEVLQGDDCRVVPHNLFTSHGKTIGPFIADVRQRIAMHANEMVLSIAVSLSLSMNSLYQNLYTLHQNIEYLDLHNDISQHACLFEGLQYCAITSGMVSCSRPKQVGQTF